MSWKSWCSPLELPSRVEPIQRFTWYGTSAPISRGTTPAGEGKGEEEENDDDEEVADEDDEDEESGVSRLSSQRGDAKSGGKSSSQCVCDVRYLPSSPVRWPYRCKN